jgi:hypothetical protein
MEENHEEPHKDMCHKPDSNQLQVIEFTVTTSLLDVHESVHRDTTMKITNKMQLYRLIYYSKSVLHVSGNVFAHHQKHLTVFTVSGSVHPSCCRLVSWMS